jgi:hypothetical protein
MVNWFINKILIFDLAIRDDENLFIWNVEKGEECGCTVEIKGQIFNKNARNSILTSNFADVQVGSGSGVWMDKNTYFYNRRHNGCLVYMAKFSLSTLEWTSLTILGNPHLTHFFISTQNELIFAQSLTNSNGLREIRTYRQNFGYVCS